MADTAEMIAVEVTSTAPPPQQAVAVPVEQQNKPKGSIFVGLFAFSTLQCAWFAFSILMAVWMNPTFWGHNALHDWHNWMAVSALMNAFAALSVMLGVVSALGIYVGAVWWRTRKQPCGIEPVARRLARVTTLISVHNIACALITTAASVIADPVALAFVAWHIAMATLSGIVSRSTRQLAHLKRVVRTDLQFSVFASVLLGLSVEQLLASLGIAWLASTGFDWSDASEGFAAFGFVAACAVSAGVSCIGAWVSGKHLLSNTDHLVAKNLRVAACMNTVLAIIGSVVAGLLRASTGVDPLVDSLFLVFFLGAVVALELRMWFLAKRSSDQNLNLDHLPDVQSENSSKSAGANGFGQAGVVGGGGDFAVATEMVAVELDQS